MFQHTTTVRICYADTDQMGFVYYGNYAKFFEIGRVEAIRSLGVTYKNMEEENFIMPVSELQIKYLKPAFYDDLLSIETRIVTLPLKHKIVFDHKVWNAKNDLLAKGSVSLYLLNKTTMQPTTLPSGLTTALQQFFKNNH